MNKQTVHKKYDLKMHVFTVSYKISCFFRSKLTGTSYVIRNYGDCICAVHYSLYELYLIVSIAVFILGCDVEQIVVNAFQTLVSFFERVFLNGGALKYSLVKKLINLV